MTVPCHRSIVAERREITRCRTLLGDSAREIAVRLNITIRSVERYRTQIRAERGPKATTPYGGGTRG